MKPLICRSCGDRWNTRKGSHLSWYLDHEMAHGWVFPSLKRRGKWVSSKEWAEMLNSYWNEHMDGWPGTRS